LSNRLEKPKYVVLGLTKGLRHSKRIIGRHKDLAVELRDVFEVSRLRKAAKKLLIFEIVESNDPDVWFLISFDIEGVRRKNGWGFRKATKEYTIIKEKMYWNLCGKIDYSTYICPQNPPNIPEKYTQKIKTWTVKPYDIKTLEKMKKEIENTVKWIVQKIQEAKGKLHGKGISKAYEIVDNISELLRSKAAEKTSKLIGKEWKEELRKQKNSLLKELRR